MCYELRTLTVNYLRQSHATILVKSCCMDMGNCFALRPHDKPQATPMYPVGPDGRSIVPLRKRLRISRISKRSREIPRSLQETRLPPEPLEERPRPSPPAVLEEDSWSIRGLGQGCYGRGRPQCVPLLEVAPYLPPAGPGRGLLLG